MSGIPAIVLRPEARDHRPPAPCDFPATSKSGLILADELTAFPASLTLHIRAVGAQDLAALHTAPWAGVLGLVELPARGFTLEPPSFASATTVLRP